MRGSSKAAIFCLLISFGIPGYSYTKEFYRWVDEKGVVHYSDTIPDQSTRKDVKLEGRIGTEAESEEKDVQKKQEELRDDNAKVKERNETIKREYEKAVREEELDATAERPKEAGSGDIVEKIRQQSERNARIRAMNEKVLKEYGEKKSETEKQNEEIRKHNEKVMEENRLLKKDYETKLSKLEKDKAEGQIAEGSEEEKRIEQYREIIKKIDEEEAWALKKNEEIQQENKKIAEEFEIKRKEIEKQNARIDQEETENTKRLESLKGK